MCGDILTLIIFIIHNNIINYIILIVIKIYLLNMINIYNQYCSNGENNYELLHFFQPVIFLS